ncbi:MAG: OmpW family outer membrane protein [Polaromonas sp.]
MRIARLTLAGLLAVLATGSVLAQQNTIKLGLSNVQPHANTSDFVAGPFTPPGISLDVLNKSMVCFSYTREINDQWDVELALGAPPTHDIVLKINNPSLPGSAQALNGQVGAKVRQVAPTLFANYKFLEKSSPLRPFIGVGINFTRFDNSSSTAAGNALNGGATSIALEDSLGVALQGGASYQINPQWSLSASLATARVKSKITTNTLGIERTADISFRPRVFTLSVGYSF